MLINALAGGGRSLPGNISLIDALPDTTNLKLCVDTGDSNSLADGSANTALLDLSAEGNDLVAGNSASADSLDPAFTGTPGALSDADYVTMDGVQDSSHSDIYSFLTNPAWMENIHKDNATFTILFVAMLTSASARFAMGNAVNTTVRGFQVQLRTVGTDQILFEATTGSGTALSASETGFSVPQNAWCIGSVGVDEAAGDGLFTLNGQSATFTSTYTTPATLDANRRFSIGSTDFQHGVTAALSVDARFAAAAFYEGRMLTQSEIGGITENLNNRFNFGG